MINRRKGFAISELVIGIVFTTIFILTNVSLYINSYKNNIEAKRFVQANNILLKKVEQVQAMDFNDITIENINTNNELDETGLYSGKYDVEVHYLGLVPNPEDFYSKSELQTETDVDTGITTNYYNYTYYDDIAKIVKVTVKFNINGQDEEYSITTLNVMPIEDILSSAIVQEKAEIVE